MFNSKFKKASAVEIEQIKRCAPNGVYVNGALKLCPVCFNTLHTITGKNKPNGDQDYMVRIFYKCKDSKCGTEWTMWHDDGTNMY